MAKPRTTSSPSAGYDAFISYSHAADGKLAPRLQNALQRLAKSWYRLRAMRVFRDQTDLSATPALWPAIERALERSSYFVLLASPEAANSPWVQKEIQTWVASGRAKQLLLVLTDGEIAWNSDASDFDWQRTTALPRELSGVFNAEPLWVDLRWARREEHLTIRNPGFLEAVAKLAAPIRGLEFDALISADHREHHRAIRLAWTAVVSLLVLTVASVTAAYIAVEARERAVASRARAEREAAVATARRLAAEASTVPAADPQRRVLLAVEAIRATSQYGDCVPAVHESLIDGLANLSGYAPAGRDQPSIPTVLQAHQDQVTAVAVSPDNRWLASASFDNTVCLWDLSARGYPGSPLRLQGHTSAVVTVGFTPDNRRLVSAGWDNTARLWDLTAADPSTQPIVLRGHEDGIDAIAISPSGRWLTTASQDGTARIWDLTAVQPASTARVLGGHGDELRTVAINPEYEWQMLGVAELRAVAISPDDQWVATAGRDGTARLWQVTAQGPMRDPLILGHEQAVFAVAFSPDNRWLVTAAEIPDCVARLWDVAKLGPTQDPLVLRGHNHTVDHVVISNDSHWLVTGDSQSATRLWDLTADDPSTTGVALRGPGQGNFINDLAISADDRWLVRANEGGATGLWDLTVANPAESAVTLPAHLGIVRAACVSRDSRWVITGGADGTVRLWTIGVEELLEHARRAVDRNFYMEEWEQHFSGESYRPTFPEYPSGVYRDRIPADAGA